MNVIAQIDFRTSGVSRSQIETILRLLLQARGRPVAAVELAKESGSLAVHSRICDLRKLGYTIINETQTVRGKRHSCYTLIGDPPDPPPKKEARRIITNCAPKVRNPTASQAHDPKPECGTEEGAPSIPDLLGFNLVTAPELPKWHDGGTQ